MPLTHAVMFTLQDAADAPEAAERLRAMAGRIPALHAIEVGLNVHTGEGQPHLLLLTRHEDLEGLRAYNDDPVHQELLSWIRPRIAARCAVDTSDLS
jgi:hypothetical protein